MGQGPKEGPVWASGHLALAQVRAMGMTQLWSGAKGTAWAFPGTGLAGPGLMLASSQPLAHLLSCLKSGDSTSFKRVQLEDRVTRMTLVTQECWVSAGVCTAWHPWAFPRSMPVKAQGWSLLGTGHCPSQCPTSLFTFPLTSRMM